MDMTKALQAAEIIKTRTPYLHQENKLQSYLATHKVEEKDQPPKERNIIRTGIAITLSRNAFDVEHQPGYQKPKPRQFVQPRPRNTAGKRHPKDRVSSVPKEDLRKKKKSGRRDDYEAMGSSEEERKASRSEFKVWGGKKQE